jgi:acyl-coenzyme A thioesterase PaaI-like protein
VSEPPPSAWRLAEQLGDALPASEDITVEALDLVARVRDLVEATLMTDAGTAQREAAARAVADVTAVLSSTARNQAVLLARSRETGRMENLTQAGNGRLNPQALVIAYDDLPEPADEPGVAEIVARCTLRPQHGGPPGRAHGGAVMMLLDEVLGMAATVGGASGMTGGLDVRLVAATPLGVPLEVRARYTHSEGRKAFVTGEVRADGTITARGTAVYVAAR